MEAAAHQFARRGYEGTTFASVAEAMGKPRSVISYAQFPSKEALSIAVVDQYLDQLQRTIDGLAGDADPGLDMLVLALRRVSELDVTSPVAAGAIRLLMERYDSVDGQRTAPVFRFVEGHITAAVRRGDFPAATDLDTVTEMLLVGAIGAHSARLHGIGTSPLPDTLRSAWEGVFRTVGVPATRIDELMRD